MGGAGRVGEDEVLGDSTKKKEEEIVDLCILTGKKAVRAKNGAWSLGIPVLGEASVKPSGARMLFFCRSSSIQSKQAAAACPEIDHTPGTWHAFTLVDLSLTLSLSLTLDIGRC